MKKKAATVELITNRRNNKYEVDTPITEEHFRMK